ncbi:MAG: hypothetical protein KKB50_20995 [Planctomycetes bacterium]|nr:hypothetical protein [Planctomycetota bacterium]
MMNAILLDGLGLAFAGLLVYGVALWSRAAAFVLAGLLGLAVVVLLTVGIRDKQRKQPRQVGYWTTTTADGWDVRRIERVHPPWSSPTREPERATKASDVDTRLRAGCDAARAVQTRHTVVGWLSANPPR